METSDFLKNITPERLDNAVAKFSDKDLSPNELIQHILELDDDLKVLFVTRGMMYICLESEFGLDGHDLWDACSLYYGLINAPRSGDPTGLDYYG
jgi:hypothetical protein